MTPEAALERARHHRDHDWDWRLVALALEAAWAVPRDKRTHEHSSIMAWPSQFIIITSSDDDGGEEAGRMRVCCHIRSQAKASRGYYTINQLLKGRGVKRSTFERCWRSACKLIAAALNQDRARDTLSG